MTGKSARRRDGRATTSRSQPGGRRSRGSDARASSEVRRGDAPRGSWPGRRRLVRLDDGTWLDIVRWESRAVADAGLPRISTPEATSVAWPGRVCDWSVSGLEPTLRVVRAAVAWLWASLQVGVVQPNRSPEGRGSDLAMMGVQLPVCQLLRPHNCAPIDHITLVLTVGRDLRKRRSAQRFPAVS
jgi:hypothetical protein